MSLPTSKAPVAQLSIRSFFHSRGSSRAPAPPSSRASPSSNGVNLPPPPSSAPPPAAAARPSPPVASPPRPTVDAPIPPPAAKLPPEAAVRPVAAADTGALRRINALLLPVNYADSFYQRAVDPAESGRFSRVVTWAHDGQEPKVVGGVVCRVEPALDAKPDSRIPQNLYIQSLCLLSPYRGMGLIDAALDNIVATAVSDPNLDVRTVTAHVWTENEEGIHWYDRRGFKRHESPIQGYYLKLRPDSAWLVQRHVGAALPSSLPSSAPMSSAPPRAAANLPTPPSSAGHPPPKNSNRPPPPPPAPSRGQSYQSIRSETEWNDLPADMAPSLPALPRKSGSEPASLASSRSSSAVRKRRDRSYPAAAFGS